MRINTHTPSRPGITLVEVLVAIVVLAIGLMALLTLFPLGALNMAQAIKDDRTGNCAANAEGIAQWTWRWGIERAPLTTPPTPPDKDIDIAMRNPGSPLLARNGAGFTGPSYPAYVDGFGYLQYTGNWQSWVGGTRGSMPRCIGGDIKNASAANKGLITITHFSLRDDLLFDANARAGTGPTSSVQREGLYSWAYLLQLPSCSNPQVADLKIVVYRRRSLQYNGDASPTGEAIYKGYPGYTSAFQSNPRMVTLTWAAPQEKPAVRRGGWIVDCTMTDPTIGATDPKQLNWRPRAYFYRVVNVTEVAADKIEVEIQTDVRARMPGQSTAQVAVLDEVVEVFDKGTLTP